MLPQSEFESPMLASAAAPVAIAAITQDRALIGLLRSVIDPTNDLILVTSEAELTPHLNSRRVSVALLDSMFIEGDLAAMAERLRDTWPDLVLVVVGTAEEQSKVAGQITSGVVYRFLHRPVSAPRVRLFVDAALRRHEVENVERTLEQTRPDFSRIEKAAKPRSSGPSPIRAVLPGLIGAAVVVAGAVVWFARSSGDGPDAAPAPAAQVVSAPAEHRPLPNRRRCRTRARRSQRSRADSTVEPRPGRGVRHLRRWPPRRQRLRRRIRHATVCARLPRRRPWSRRPKKSRRARRRRRCSRFEERLRRATRAGRIRPAARRARLAGRTQRRGLVPRRPRARSEQHARQGAAWCGLPTDC